jgi:hypothetical protein
MEYGPENKQLFSKEHDEMWLQTIPTKTTVPYNTHFNG